MMKKINIAQLTDIHIGEEGHVAYGVDVRASFLQVINDLARYNPDYLIISGDLCHHKGSEEIYGWIKEQIEIHNLRTLVIPGNHDNPAVLAEIFAFKTKQDQLFYSSNLGPARAIFLDTSQGYLSELQLNWLREQLSSADRKIIIFMHHPPVVCNIPYMDNNYSLKKMEDFQKIINSYQKEIIIFCGHYHAEKTILQEKMKVFLTPSTFFQIGQESNDLKVENHLIGWRKITIEGEKILTTVKYLER